MNMTNEANKEVSYEHWVHVEFCHSNPETSLVLTDFNAESAGLEA